MPATRSARSRLSPGQLTVLVALHTLGRRRTTEQVAGWHTVASWVAASRLDELEGDYVTRKGNQRRLTGSCRP